MSLSADHDAIAAQLGPYFDGELTPDDEVVVLEHLADCDRCQAALDDLMGMHVALGRQAHGGAALSPDAVSSTAARPSPAAGAIVTPLAAPRRWRAMVGGVALAAAAAAAVVVWAPWRGRRGEPQLALADGRPVEVRFTAHAFADHRPYRVDRGSADSAPISLATLSALERRGDRAALAAALAWSGDRGRARAVLDTMPPTPAVLADRAALDLLLGRPDDALDAADRALLADATLTAARWNRALALRDLHLPLAAAAELDLVAGAGDDGWAAEATSRAAALRDDVVRRRAAIADATRRRLAAYGGGPGLTAADVGLAPSPARIYFHDALRLAASAADLDRLAPLAAALDRLGGGTEASDELARVRTLDLGRRATFGARYRAVATRSATPADIDALLAELAAGGPALDDLRLGVLVLAGRVATQLADVEAIVARSASDNPMFQLLVVQERLAAGRPGPGDRELAERLCGSPAWALRCGTIDRWAAMAQTELGMYADAERLAWRSLARLTDGGVGTDDEYALMFLATVLQYRGRLALSSAALAEARARRSTGDCAAHAFLDATAAELARRRGDITSARTLLADPARCPDHVDMVALGAAIDLARDTGASADRARADRWLDAARRAGVPALLVDVGSARLHVEDGGTAAEALTRAIAAPSEGDLGPVVRDWAVRTLIAHDGAHGDWKAAFEHTLAAVGQEGPTTCAIALAADDAIQTAAWRDANGNPGGAQWKLPAPWPALPPTALAGCATTAVIAMSPLHGRPPPWSLGAWAWSTGRPPAAPSSARGDALVIAATAPPHELLDLPNLAPVAIPPGARGLTGADATPTRVAAAMATATYVEIHAHGLVDLDTDDGGFIALSPDGDGDWRLSASDLRGVKLAGAPVVVLAACRAAEAAPDQLRRWSLPDAFLAAGARAVIAADVAVPDDLIRLFVDDVRARLDRGEPPAAAAAAARATLVATDPRRATWVDRLMVFE